MSDPREGLPPCTKLALCDGRMSALIDQAVCNHDWGGGRYRVQRGITNGSWDSHPDHPEVSLPDAECVGGLLDTDDPDEAQAAFERGAEWVRTGEMA